MGNLFTWHGLEFPPSINKVSMILKRSRVQCYLNNISVGSCSWGHAICTVTGSGPKIPAASHLEGGIFWDLWLRSGPCLYKC